MSKLTTAEEKLLMKGFDYATDLNVFDPYYDDTDVLKQLEIDPNLKATELSKLTKLPTHRVIAAMMRLKAKGKLPTVKSDKVINFRSEQSDLPIVEPCSRGNEGSCANERNATAGTLVTILDSEGLWKIDSLKDGHAKIDLVKGDRHLPKRRRVALCKLRTVNPESCSTGNEPPKQSDFSSLTGFVVAYREWENSSPDQVNPMALKPGTKIKLSDDSIAEIVEPINPPGCFVNAVNKNGEALQVADGDYVVLGETVEAVEPKTNLDIPHWLTGKNAAEAKALIDLGFWCVGSVDNWGEPEAKKIIKTSGDWTFNYDQIGMFVEGRCNGAVFNINIDEDEQTPEQDKELINKAIATIKKAAEDWGLQFGQQLTIFDCEQTQNREQENILLTDPPRQVEVNGQLSIFFDDCSEPPDPDDFETGDEYEEAYDQWAVKFPELNAAINRKKSQEIKNRACEVRDYIQLKTDPRRIGQIIALKSGGIYKVKFADGFECDLKPDQYNKIPFSKDISNLEKGYSPTILGESFFKVGEFVTTNAPSFENKIFKVEKIHCTGMVSVIDKANQSFSFPANWLNHYVEKIEKAKGKILENSERKRPAKGCGSGSLVTRQANKKRNAAKGRDPDIYYVYCYSYTDNYGKEIKSSISVPREKIVQVKSMIERKEHYVKIAKFLGKSLPVYY